MAEALYMLQCLGLRQAGVQEILWAAVNAGCTWASTGRVIDFFLSFPLQKMQHKTAEKIQFLFPSHFEQACGDLSLSNK